MSRNIVARRADAFAHWTRLDRLTLIDQREPRNLRWWPALALVAMTIGYALVVASAHKHLHSFPILLGGGVLFFGTFGACTYIRALGPRLYRQFDRSLDEREQMLRARAGHLSWRMIGLLAIAGCFYCGMAPVFGWWHPASNIDWVYLGLLIEGWALVLPTLVASWLQPRGDGDD